jgi:hypothetical protein
MPPRKTPLGSRWQKRNGSGYLSENQQRRYMNKGVTESQYRDKSFSLQVARGHELGEKKHGQGRTGGQAINIIIHVPAKNGIVAHTEVFKLDHASTAERSRAAKHRSAVLYYLEGKDPDGRRLRRFQGQKIAGYLLETDFGLLDHLGSVDDLSFETLYPSIEAA